MFLCIFVVGLFLGGGFIFVVYFINYGLIFFGGGFVGFLGGFLIGLGSSFVGGLRLGFGVFIFSFFWSIVNSSLSGGFGSFLGLGLSFSGMYGLNCEWGCMLSSFVFYYFWLSCEMEWEKEWEFECGRECECEWECECECECECDWSRDCD